MNQFTYTIVDGRDYGYNKSVYLVTCNNIYMKDAKSGLVSVWTNKEEVAEYCNRNNAKFLK